jgi:CheY-like chemotaxis protein
MDFSDLKILVVDDELPSRMLISTLLEKEFNSVVKCLSNGKETIEYLRKHSTDLLILDLQMPEMDGYTTLVHIRSMDDCRDLPVIPCTALSSRELLINMKNLNITDYIVKPIIKKTFLDKISHVLHTIMIKKNMNIAKLNKMSANVG